MEVSIKYVYTMEVSTISCSSPSSIIWFVSWNTNVSIMTSSISINCENTHIIILRIDFGFQGDLEVMVRPMVSMSLCIVPCDMIVVQGPYTIFITRIVGIISNRVWRVWYSVEDNISCSVYMTNMFPTSTSICTNIVYYLFRFTTYNISSRTIFIGI